ncbi:basic salivary proline-rich protein 1-like [Kryptolebias marmoratus]|uniref:basic salivary proline-rich protein 1-like n=1 Tax=Kryptolebias marmoratus TaxID=37003 RepID=UPI0007F8FFF0|nr:basic salivary proline-rich protein 1-like [Kryptolebias marmoratus]
MAPGRAEAQTHSSPQARSPGVPPQGQPDPTQEGSRGKLQVTPSSHDAEAPGAAATSQRERPEPRGRTTPQPRPDRARAPGPQQAATKASRHIPRHPAPDKSHPSTGGQRHQPPVQVTPPKGAAYPWTQEMAPFSLGWRRADSPTLRRRARVAHEPRREPGATRTTPVQPPAPTPSRDRPGRVHPVPTPSRNRPGRVHPALMGQPANQPEQPQGKAAQPPSEPHPTPQTPPTYTYILCPIPLKKS